MKKGFTLIELLAVVVLLAIIITVVYSSVLKGINNVQNKVDSATEVIYIAATEDYIEENQGVYDSRDGNMNCLLFKTLLDNGYISKSVFNSQNIVSENDYMVFYGTGISFDIKIDYEGVCNNE